MKKKINLLSLSKNELKNLKGSSAGGCYCGCYYEGRKECACDDYHGGSSTEDNDSANTAGGLSS